MEVESSAGNVSDRIYPGIEYLHGFQEEKMKLSPLYLKINNTNVQTLKQREFY